MRLITGGLYQGKREFVRKKYGITPNDIFDVDKCPFSAIYSRKCIDNYDRIIKILTEKNENPFLFTEQLIKNNPDVIIIMNEIGNGIIPIEKSERVWREQVGKIGCILAEHSETVERIVCGTVIILKE